MHRVSPTDPSKGVVELRVGVHVVVVVGLAPEDMLQAVGDVLQQILAQKLPHYVAGVHGTTVDAVVRGRQSSCVPTYQQIRTQQHEPLRPVEVAPHRTPIDGLRVALNFVRERHCLRCHDSAYPEKARCGRRPLDANGAEDHGVRHHQRPHEPCTKEHHVFEFVKFNNVFGVSERLPRNRFWNP